MWTGFIWLREQIEVESCEYEYDIQVSIKVEELLDYLSDYWFQSMKF
jgi:hypothetical protein